MSEQVPHLPNALDDLVDAIGNPGNIVVDKRIIGNVGQVDYADGDANLWRVTLAPMKLVPFRTEAPDA